MRFLTVSFTIFSLFLPATMRADDAPIVLELFTSEGCSSCPPADELLQEFAKRDDVIALALHVDYWDYLGWKDEHAQPAFTKRQQNYAYVGKRRTIFTPELIVQGQSSVAGHSKSHIQASIAAHQESPKLATISIEKSANGFSVNIAPVGQSAPAADLLLVGFLPDASVAIKRGENAGETILYTNIVGNVSAIGSWSGSSETTIEIEKLEGPQAIIVQQQGHGPILSAARLD